MRDDIKNALAQRKALESSGSLKFVEESRNTATFKAASELGSSYSIPNFLLFF